MLTIENEVERRLGAWSLVKAQWQVLVALMLRDINSRWGSSLGFLVAVLWPASHIGILVGIWTSLGRIAPYGDSAILWFTVGMVPFILVSYISRFVILGLITNKPLLIFPVIKITDILISRMIVEVVNAAAVVILICSVMWYLGVDFMPHNLREAALALGVAVLMGLGLGFLNALVAAAVHTWITVYTLFIVALWITSGVLFVPSAFPEYVRDILYFHPIIHLIEWIREAYYPGYNSTVLDRQFVVFYSVSTLALGMALERVFRGRVMM